MLYHRDRRVDRPLVEWNTHDEESIWRHWRLGMSTEHIDSGTIGRWYLVHDFVLPPRLTTLTDSNFIIRQLFKDSY